MAALSTIALTALTGISAVSSIMGGMQAQEAANSQAMNAMAFSTLQAQEAGKTAAREAHAVEKDADSVARRQKIAYLASGVSLEGSPLLVMEETRRKGAENADEILRSASSYGAAGMMEGRVRANALKDEGRAAFISGITNAVGSVGNAAGAFI